MLTALETLVTETRIPRSCVSKQSEKRRVPGEAFTAVYIHRECDAWKEALLYRRSRSMTIKMTIWKLLFVQISHRKDQAHSGQFVQNRVDLDIDTHQHVYL